MLCNKQDISAFSGNRTTVKDCHQRDVRYCARWPMTAPAAYMPCSDCSPNLPLSNSGVM